MTILLEPHIIPLVQETFPEAQVVIGVDQIALSRDLVITVHAIPQPIGEYARGALWTVDFTVLDIDRDRGAETAHALIRLMQRAVSEGKLPVAGVKVIDLPEIRVHSTASQQHSAIHCAVRFAGHYG